MPRKNCECEDVEMDAVFAHLALEETASRTQRAYAASKTSVTVQNTSFSGDIFSVKQLVTK